MPFLGGLVFSQLWGDEWGGREAQVWEVMMFSSIFLFAAVMTELGAVSCSAGLGSSVIKAETPLL